MDSYHPVEYLVRECLCGHAHGFGSITAAITFVPARGHVNTFTSAATPAVALESPELVIERLQGSALSVVAARLDDLVG
jgi:hypothetical protein